MERVRFAVLCDFEHFCIVFVFGRFTAGNGAGPVAASIANPAALYSFLAHAVAAIMSMEPDRGMSELNVPGLGFEARQKSPRSSSAEVVIVVATSKLFPICRQAQDETSAQTPKPEPQDHHPILGLKSTPEALSLGTNKFCSDH